MSFELAATAAKVIETGKKVVEVAKKVEKVTSSVEKTVKSVEKVTADKDENWGADLVKTGVKKGIREVEGNLADKLKHFLKKNDICSESSEVGKESESTGEDDEEKQTNGDSADDRCSLKETLNKYLDSSDSQTQKEDNIKEKQDNEALDSDEGYKNDNNEETIEHDKPQEDNETSASSVDNVITNGGNDIKDVNIQEYNSDGTRGLTETEKQVLKDKLGWSDEKIKKCTIDKDGVLNYKTDRCDLEGKTSENGVPYERRRIEINGVVIEGVFPKFDSVFDTELSPDNLKTKAYAKECNAALKEAIANDSDLRSKFTSEQIKDIEDGRTPTGYVWHHNEEPGKMQLVKREDHDRAIGGAAHTGGNSLWGADSIDNRKKGESF